MFLEIKKIQPVGVSVEGLLLSSPEGVLLGMAVGAGELDSLVGISVVGANVTPKAVGDCVLGY